MKITIEQEIIIEQEDKIITLEPGDQIEVMESEEVEEAKTGTFKCPDCGTKVLKNTEYCLSCKKKVKEK